MAHLRGLYVVMQVTIKNEKYRHYNCDKVLRYLIQVIQNSNAIDSKSHATVQGFYQKPKGYSFIQSFYRGGS